MSRLTPGDVIDQHGHGSTTIRTGRGRPKRDANPALKPLRGLETEALGHHGTGEQTNPCARLTHHSFKASLGDTRITTPSGIPSQDPPEVALLRLLFGRSVSMAISVVAKLRVADLLADGPKTLADLGAKTKTHAPSLHRVLRTLVAVGVFAETDGRFALTPMGGHLRTGVKGSLRGVADFCGSEWNWRTCGDLLQAVQTGSPAFDRVFGEPVFNYLGRHPDEAAVFDEGMTGISSSIGPAVAEAYNFASFKTVVDVGGGHGVLLSTILQAYPGVNGVVFDSPHVVIGAEDTIRKVGLGAAVGHRRQLLRV